VVWQHRYIYLRGEIGRNMYVIQNGMVGVMDWKTNQPLSCLERGAYFGEGAALGDFRRRSTMKSYSMVHLLALNYNHMRVRTDRTLVSYEINAGRDVTIASD
jgi:CRP-like cAMP-binding protein